METIKNIFLAILCMAIGIASILLAPYMMALGVGAVVFLIIKLVTYEEPL